MSVPALQRPMVHRALWLVSLWAVNAMAFQPAVIRVQSTHRLAKPLFVRQPPSFAGTRQKRYPAMLGTKHTNASPGLHKPLARPTIALTTIMAVMHASPMMMDCLFAGVLYVLGKITSSAITGTRESQSGLTKWFICGLVDGYVTHLWYSFLALKFAFISNNLARTLAMTAVSSAFFTPLYCAGFLLLLSLLDGNGISGAKARLLRDWKSLSIKSSKVWGVANIPLFLLVPLHMRVAASMAMHYFYLVGLALWDTKAQMSAQPHTEPGTSSRGHQCDTRVQRSAQLQVEPESEMAWSSVRHHNAAAQIEPTLNLACAKMLEHSISSQQATLQAQARSGMFDNGL